VNGAVLSRLAISVVVLAGLFCSANAWAANVILVQPLNPSTTMVEAIVRVRGELISEGFQVEVMSGPEGGQVRHWLEVLASTRKADAVVAVLGDATPDSVELWVVDQVTEKTVVRRIPFKPESDLAPKTFAIHALELLRASFLEIDLLPANHPSTDKPIPTAVVHFVDRENIPNPSRRFGIEAAGAVVFGLGDIGPAFVPILRLGWAINSSLVAQVDVAGFGTQAHVHHDTRRAQVAESFLLLGARRRFLPDRQLYPTLSLSAGVLHTRAEGEDSSTVQGREAVLWSGLLDLGLGIRRGLAHGIEVEFASHLQFANPYPAIRFDGSVVATSVYPSLLFILSMGAWP